VRYLRNEAQRGFTLLETVIGGALSCAVALSLAAAALGTLHASARLERTANVTDHALNILSDLREATAYDSAGLRNIVGRTVTTTFSDGDAVKPSTMTATIAVARVGPLGPIFAAVTVKDPAGVSVTERQILFAEVPAPGSVINAATPSPAAGG
jgi:type II secretory pathway pseudopilin PulG